MSSQTLMDLAATLLELQSWKRKLEEIIAELEELQAQDGSPGIKRRGRKFMGPEERKEVSRRMMMYWANRRKLKKERQQTA